MIIIMLYSIHCISHRLHLGGSPYSPFFRNLQPQHLEVQFINCRAMQINISPTVESSRKFITYLKRSNMIFVYQNYHLLPQAYYMPMLAPNMESRLSTYNINGLSFSCFKRKPLTFLKIITMLKRKWNIRLNSVQSWQHRNEKLCLTAVVSILQTSCILYHCFSKCS